MSKNHNNPGYIRLCAAYLYGNCNQNGPCHRGLEHRNRTQIDNRINGSYKTCDKYVNAPFCRPIKDCTNCLQQRNTLVLQSKTLTNNLKSIQEQIEINTDIVKTAKSNLDQCRYHSKNPIEINDADIKYSHALNTMNDFIDQRRVVKNNLQIIKNNVRNLPNCDHHICPIDGICNQCNFGECTNRLTCFCSHNLSERRNQLDKNENNALTQKYVICSHFRLFGNCTNVNCNYLHNGICEAFRVGNNCTDVSCTLNHFMSNNLCKEASCRMCYPNICNNFRKSIVCDNLTCRYNHYLVPPAPVVQQIEHIVKETRIIINSEQEQQLIDECGIDIDENGNEVIKMYELFNVFYRFESAIQQPVLSFQKQNKVRNNYINEEDEVEEDYEDVPRNFRHSSVNHYIIPEAVAPVINPQVIRTEPRIIRSKVLRKNKFKELDNESYWLDYSTIPIEELLSDEYINQVLAAKEITKKNPIQKENVIIS
uniref:C3H1-type domain-containing protein n=1 Tax=viral metagenome TaxID=1070528 RepID=A0A6C0DBB2_9ZZZZ